MAKLLNAFVWMVIIILILTLGATCVAIIWQTAWKGDVFQLAGLLFSWEAITGGLAIGAVLKWETQITKILNSKAGIP